MGSEGPHDNHTTNSVFCEKKKEQCGGPEDPHKKNNVGARGPSCQ